MKKLLLFIAYITLATSLSFSSNKKPKEIDGPNSRVLNFGVKAGFNSSMFLVSQFKIKDVTIKDFQNNYEIGYFGALFMRFNIHKNFIQPELSYNVSRCEITFDNLGSQHPDIEPNYATLTSYLHSIHIPLLFAYHEIGL